MRNIFKEKEYREDIRVFGWILLIALVATAIMVLGSFLMSFISTALGLTGIWDTVFCMASAAILVVISFFVGHMIFYLIKDKLE